MRIIFFYLLIIFVIDLFSIPRFAIMRGNQCKDCHSNPTGGLIRSQDGWNYGKKNLRMFRSAQNIVSPFLNENISVGIDFRFQYLYSQELKRTDFHKMSAATYFDIAMSDELRLITAYDLYRRTFEGYGILTVLPFDGYFKIGTFAPNFGIRIDDHTAYTRNGDAGILSSTPSQGLIFSSFYTQTGVELGIYPSDFSFITLSVGQDKAPFRVDPSYIGRIELTPSILDFNILLGSTYGIFRTTERSYSLINFFAGIGSQNFSIIGEIVYANNYTGHDLKSTIYMLETSYRLMKGLDFVSRYDRIEPNINSKEIYSSHLIFGFDFYPYSFFEIKPQIRINLENPKVEKNNSIVLQFHFWY